MSQNSGRMKEIRKLTLLPGELDEQEREKVRRRIRGAQRKFMRANRQIDFGRVPSRARVELSVRLSDFGDVIKEFELNDFLTYGDWKADFDLAVMNVTAFLDMLVRDYEVVKIQHLTIPAEMRERKGGEIGE